jgi:hypothetical protein
MALIRSHPSPGEPSAFPATFCECATCGCVLTSARAGTPNAVFVPTKDEGVRNRVLTSSERRKAMVAKKAKSTKKVKDLGVRKVTSSQAKRVKGGIGSGVGKRGWVDLGKI